MRRLGVGRGRVRGLWFSPDGHRLVVRETGGHGAEQLHAYDLAAGRTADRLTLGPTEWVAVSPDRRRAAFAVPRDRDWKVFCRDLDPDSDAPPWQADWAGGLLLGLAFSADGRTLAGAGSRGTRGVVRRWGAAGGDERPPFDVPWAVYALAFSPGGAHVAGGDTDRSARVWDRHHARVVDLAHPATVHRLAFSPDGTVLAAVSGLGVTLWGVPAGTRRAELGPHPGPVLDVAFAADGRTLATACADPAVRLWSADGRPLGALDWGVGRARAVAFSPDGLTAAAGGDAGQVVVWDLHT